MSLAEEQLGRIRRHSVFNEFVKKVKEEVERYGTKSQWFKCAREASCGIWPHSEVL
jgi:hypothetical protein